MRLKRFLQHVAMSPAKAALAFPRKTLDAIQQEIAAQESRHRGEICFIVEAELSGAHLWREVTARERACEVFAQYGVWNTEENNGALIYLLLAERRVEIVADRGIDARVTRHEWQAICHAMRDHFVRGEYEQGAIEGVRAVSELLAKHFPATGARRNELPDRPLLI